MRCSRRRRRAWKASTIAYVIPVIRVEVVPHLGEELKGVHSHFAVGVGFPEFDHLDVVLKDLLLLLVRHFSKQVPDPLPGFEEL